MSWTNADLDRLNTAIASGARRVRYSDHEVEYRSMDEMLMARSLIERELSQDISRGHSVYKTSKGL